MIVVSIAFVVITANYAFAIGISSTQGNLDPLSEPSKKAQNAISKSVQNIDVMKKEKMKTTIDVTLSLLEKDDVIDHLASKMIKKHTSGQITKGDVKEHLKKFSQLLKENKDYKAPTASERFEWLVQDLRNLSKMTSTRSEFHFCNAIIEKMPEFLNTTFENISDNDMDTMMINFEKECRIADSENPLDLNPIFINSFDLCSHLPDVLKLHLSFGLPEYVENTTDHFCTYLVDMIFPSEIEHPCMLIMEQMQYQYAKDKSLKNLIPYPNLILANDFKNAFMKVCTSSKMGDKSEKLCDSGFKNITVISNKTIQNVSNMTMLEYTNLFCLNIGFKLEEHANNLLEKNKSTKYSTRNTISHAFSLLQRYRHGIIDSTGNLMQSKSKDLHDTDTIMEHVPGNRSLLELNSCCPQEELVDCYNPPSAYELNKELEGDGSGVRRGAEYKMGGECAVGLIHIPVKEKREKQCHDKCFQKDIGNIDNDQYRKFSACSGRAGTTGTGVGVGLGPLIVAGGSVHGYGKWNDPKNYYKNPRLGNSIIKWAEQDFTEHCVGINPLGLIITDIGDIFQIEMSFETGYLRSFDDVAGFTKVESFSGSFFIFSSSSSIITCCPTDDVFADDCERCGSATGLGIFFPPTWGDIDASIQSCYAYPVSVRSNANFDASTCRQAIYRLVLSCEWKNARGLTLSQGGPYHMITINATILGVKKPIYRGTICNNGASENTREGNMMGRNSNGMEENWRQLKYIHRKANTVSYIDFVAPANAITNDASLLGEITFANNMPHQVVTLDYFSICECVSDSLLGYYEVTKGWQNRDVDTAFDQDVLGYRCWKHSYFDTDFHKWAGGNVECRNYGVLHGGAYQFFPGPVYTARAPPDTMKIAISKTNKSNWDESKQISQTSKCEGWDFNLKSCCNEKLIENGIGCYYEGTVCRGHGQPNQTSCLGDIELDRLPGYTCGNEVKNLGRFQSALDCANAVAGDPQCTQTVFMWIYESWGCRCCASRSINVDVLRNIYQIADPTRVLDIFSTCNNEYSFKPDAVRKGNVIWTNRDHVFGDVPSEIQGIALLTGPVNIPQGCILTFVGMSPGVFYALLMKSRDGGYITNLLQLGWTQLDEETSWKSTTHGEHSMVILMVKNFGENLVLPAANISTEEQVATVVFGWKKPACSVGELRWEDTRQCQLNGFTCTRDDGERCCNGRQPETRLCVPCDETRLRKPGNSTYVAAGRCDYKANVTDGSQLTISSTSNAEYSFKAGALEKENVVWNDRNYVFGDVPPEIQGIALLTGPTRVPKGDIITFSGMQAGVFYALLTKSRDGGYKTNLLGLGWTQLEEETSWVFYGEDQFMDILSTKNDGTDLVLPASQTDDAVVVFGWKQEEGTITCERFEEQSFNTRCSGTEIFFGSGRSWDQCQEECRAYGFQHGKGCCEGRADSWGKCAYYVGGSEINGYSDSKSIQCSL